MHAESRLQGMLSVAHDRRVRLQRDADHETKVALAFRETVAALKVQAWFRSRVLRRLYLRCVRQWHDGMCPGHRRRAYILTGLH